MAIINQIGGISTGTLIGVAEGPLSDLYRGNQLSRFQYPMDIGNDPARMHFVMFDIKDIQPIQYTQSQVNNFVNGSTLGGAAQNAVQTVQQNGFLSSIASEASKITSEVSSFVSNLNTKLEPKTTKTKASIVLYMPDTLAINYSQQYTELSLIDATGGLNRVAGAAGSLTEELINGIKNKSGFKNIAATMIEKNQDVGLEMLGNAGSSVTGGNMTPLLMKAFGKAINPQLQLIYQGLGFRTFTMEFLFTPKTPEEAAQVTAIINTFVYASHPTITGTAGMYFIPPSIFNISFKMAQSGTFAGVKSTLQNIGNNVVGGLPLGNLANDTINQKYGINASVENDRLFKVADCVLEDISVDYAPNGWAAYNDGAPVQTRMTLTFKELTINDRNRMAGNVKDGQTVR